MYGRILLAYDGSVEDSSALREGALLARQWGASVYILSVLPEGAGKEIRHRKATVEPLVRRLDLHQAGLERSAERLRQMGLDPVTKLVFGGAVRQIAAFAKLIGADLVVVGRHRRGRFSRWWSGAAGDYITDHVNCSVLVARIAADAFEIEGH